MLTFDDAETIKNAIMKRLHEPGKTEIADIEVKNVVGTAEKPLAAGEVPHIQAGIWFIFKDRINKEGLVDCRSFFDLPQEFERVHVLNEIDQIDQQLKIVRRETLNDALVYRPGAEHQRKAVIGTGLRGLWPDKAPERQN